MAHDVEHYPVVYIIFTLLSAIRRGIERKNIWREFRRQNIALKPRLSFWLAVCRQAGLLSGNQKLMVTRHARAWLNKAPDEQAFLLIEAWQNAPKNIKARHFRKKLLWKLKHDKPLTKKDLGALNGLEALGLFKEGKLTQWGKFFLTPHASECFGGACGVKGEGALPTPKPSEPCIIHAENFIAPLPDHTDLLWDLEKYLRPASPGKYPLTKRALRFRQGDPDELISLLEKGLQAQIPEDTRALLFNQPSLRVMEGVILEFSDPKDLSQLRRQPNLRQHIDQFLSPRHVLLANKESASLLLMLKRRGVFMNTNEEALESKKKRTHFPQKVLLPPTGKTLPKRELLEKYMQLQQALDVLYHAPGFPAEQRRITPLSIEPRGEHTYVTAYCQTRRAQRLFRLDRMEIPGTY